MSESAQWIVVGVVVAAAVCAAARALWRIRRRARQGNVRCAGCPLAATCQKQKAARRQQCPRPKAESGD